MMVMWSHYNIETWNKVEDREDHLQQISEFGMSSQNQIV